MKYSKEKEKEYYNRKLLKGGIMNSITELGDDVDNGKYNIPWRNFSANFIGTFIGLTVNDIIVTEARVSNTGLRFCADVLILIVMITLVNVVFMAFSKLLKLKAN